VTKSTNLGTRTEDAILNRFRQSEKRPTAQSVKRLPASAEPMASITGWLEIQRRAQSRIEEPTLRLARSIKRSLMAD
jgi:hypothetical protein